MDYVHSAIQLLPVFRVFFQQTDIFYDLQGTSTAFYLKSKI
jgi:hypothetical protein